MLKIQTQSNTVCLARTWPCYPCLIGACTRTQQTMGPRDALRLAKDAAGRLRFMQCAPSYHGCWQNTEASMFSAGHPVVAPQPAHCAAHVSPSHQLVWCMLRRRVILPDKRVLLRKWRKCHDPSSLDIATASSQSTLSLSTVYELLSWRVFVAYLSQSHKPC